MLGKSCSTIVFHKGLNTWNTWNILHTARKCAHDAMHTPHQQADDSMIVRNEGVINPRIFPLLRHLYKDTHIQDASLF